MMRWLRFALHDLQRRPENNRPVLDVFRSLAILLVIGYHVGMRGHYLAFGWSGVDLFFVLSGYLIGTQLLRELYATRTIQAGAFILRRGFRIWPLYYFFAALMIVSAVVSRGLPVRAAVRASWADLLCVSNYGRATIPGGWSLSTEEQFYILLPVLLLLGSKLVTPGKLMAIPMAWMALLPLSRWLSMKAGESDLYSPFHIHSEGLAMGVVLAWAGLRRDTQLTGWQRALVAAAALGVALLLRSIQPFLFAFTAYTIFFGAAVWLSLPCWPPAPVRWQGFYVLSRLSYGVYLNHLLIFQWIEPRLPAGFGLSPASFMACWLGVLLLAMAAAFVTFAFVELPFLRLRQRRLQPHPVEVVPALKTGQEYA